MRADPIAPDLSVGELARRSGVAVSTIHFYEARGLICAWRTGGNQRRFAREALRRVAFVRVAQRVGIALAAISPPRSRPSPKAARPGAPTGRAWPDCGARSSTDASRSCASCAIRSTIASVAGAFRSTAVPCAIRPTSWAGLGPGPRRLWIAPVAAAARYTPDTKFPAPHKAGGRSLTTGIDALRCGMRRQTRESKLPNWHLRFDKKFRRRKAVAGGRLFGAGLEKSRPVTGRSPAVSCAAHCDVWRHALGCLATGSWRIAGASAIELASHYRSVAAAI
jgi:MerR family transcriptional regulator, redox-sensitive transcriptional activator SoxR